MTDLEKGVFLKLYNRGGYVLDFSTADFDIFTSNSIGIALCKKYGLSKGKSLTCFVNEESNDLVNKLLLDLLEYYETQYPYFEKEQDESYNSNFGGKEVARYYSKCKEIAKKINNDQFSLFATNSNV